MKKYSIFWLPFSRELRAGERLSRFSILNVTSVSLLNCRRTGEGRREESRVRCSVRWHVAVVWVHRPLSNIQKDKMDLTDNLWTSSSVLLTPSTSFRKKWIFPSNSNSQGQCPYIPPVSSKYTCLCVKTSPLHLYLGCSHSVKHSQVWV